jgi:hypothetical protein
MITDPHPAWLEDRLTQALKENAAEPTLPAEPYWLVPFKVRPFPATPVDQVGLPDKVTVPLFPDESAAEVPDVSLRFQ